MSLYDAFEFANWLLANAAGWIAFTLGLSVGSALIIGVAELVE